MKRNDESGIIISWLLKVGLFLLVVGVILFDVGAIVVNKVTLDSAAEDIAIAVSISVSDQNANSRIFPDAVVYDMAVEVMKIEENAVAGARVVRKGTEVAEDGTVHIRLKRRTETLIADLIGPLKKYTVSTGDGQAGTN